jgi:integrase
MSAEPTEPDGTGAKRRRSKKRANGQGSIYQRKDGRWAGAAFVLSSDGTFKRVLVYGRTAEEVDAKLTELKARSNRGLPADATGWTVKAYAAYWLDHVAANKIRPSTLARYRSMMERYVLPPLGRKRLTALSPADVRVMLARAEVRPIRFHDLRHTCATLLLAAGVSPRVVMDILGHSQIAVTMNIYGHVIPAMQQEAAGQMDAARGDESADDGDDAGEGPGEDGDA